MENENQLLTKINEAVAAANEAEKTAKAAHEEANKASETARTAEAESVSRSNALGLLLIEAKNLHPKTKDFDAFLDRVVGLKKTRARELIAIAGGDITEEESKEKNRQRQQKHRANKKRTKPALFSVTSAPVTETDSESAHAWEEFSYACQHWLPKMTKDDRHKAYLLVTDLVANERKAEAA